jgi:AbrB family looped-hinge helix DNA binding protein
MSKEVSYLTKDKGQSKVIREAAVAYIAGDERLEAVSTISSKNQITLPVHVLRALGIGAGDRLAVTVEGRRLVLRPRPKDWVAYHAGSLPRAYGRNAAEADAYVRELRDDAERDNAIERAWAGPEPAP